MSRHGLDDAPIEALRHGLPPDVQQELRVRLDAAVAAAPSDKRRDFMLQVFAGIAERLRALGWTGDEIEALIRHKAH